MKSVRRLLLTVNIILVVTVAAAIGGTARNAMKKQIRTSLDMYRETLYKGYDDAVKYQVQNVITLLEGIYGRHQAGELTEEAAKKEAIACVKSLRYGDDDSGYFWIDGLDYILVAHPILEEDEGTNRYELEDQNGVKIVQEILSAAQASAEGGFNEFYFTKADGVTVAPKRAYSMLFEPWGWVVSTGNYIDDIEAEYAKKEVELNAKLDRQVQMTNLCTACMLVLSILVTVVYATAFTRPLREIRDLAMRLSKCDFSQPLNLKKKNEFGQTAKTLDYAQENLQSYIHDVSRQLGEMAAGNFDIHAEVEYQGEFQEIHLSLEKIVSSMNAVLLNIHRSAEQVSMGAQQVSDGTQQLASATVEQAASIQEVSQRMGKISEQAQHNSGNAEDAKEFAVQTKAYIETGKERMQELMDAIHDISEASDSIEKIIKSIDDIAFQTNLLALNAAVEASHAGDLGKGFSVVADEVRNLAEKASQSASDTQELIENCLRAVDRGTELAEEMETALNAIVEKNKATRLLVTEIAEESRKQAQESEYINEQIGAVAGVTQTNSATVEESAASSEVLSQQAEAMKNLAGQFRLSGSPSGTGELGA